MYIEKFWKDNDILLLGVSGGKDSVCLLHLLYKQLNCPREQLRVVHVNHGMRASSAKDEQFVRELCLSYQLKFFVNETAPVMQSEEAARAYRYQFFKQIYEQENCTYLLTGHHLNDNAETILFKLIRGESLSAVAGIKSIQMIDGMQVRRPLLYMAQQDITDYVQLNDLVYVEDETNFQRMYSRNRIRLDVIPLLEKENKQALEQIVFFAKQLQEQEEIIFDYIVQVYNQVMVSSYNEVYLNIGLLNAYKESVKKRVIKYFLTQRNISITKSLLNSSLNLIKSQDGEKKIAITKRAWLCRSYDKLFILKETPIEKSCVVLNDDNSQVVINNLEVSYTKDDVEQSIIVPNANPVEIRNRQSGDYIVFETFHKKLNRVLIDCKIPRHERDALLLVAQGNRILGILDNRIQLLFKYEKIGKIENRYISYKKKEEHV